MTLMISRCRRATASGLLLFRPLLAGFRFSIFRRWAIVAFRRTMHNTTRNWERKYYYLREAGAPRRPEILF